MSNIQPKWIIFIVRDQDGSMIYNSGISGSAHQRRTRLRALLQRLRQGRDIVVSKNEWVKGRGQRTTKMIWSKELPAI